MAALSLRAYALGLVAFMLVKVLAPGYYARKDTATPVKYGIVAMVANMALNVAFVLPLMFYFNVGHLGLALATSVAAYINAGLLLRGLLRADVYVFQPGWNGFALRLFAATAAMAAAVLYATAGLDQWLAWSWQQRALQISMVVGVGALAYLLVHLVVGTRFRHLRAPGTV
jgi:putative peptidoglycan lipid II flippase